VPDNRPRPFDATRAGRRTTEEERGEAVTDDVLRFSLPIERGKVREFALAVGETDPVYFSQEAARRAGLPDVPAPPTFSVTQLWQVPRERREAHLGATLDYARVLHGEQEFAYRRAPVAGEVLDASMRIIRDSTKQGRRGGRMRVVTYESRFAGAGGDEVLRALYTLIETSRDPGVEDPPGAAEVEAPPTGDPGVRGPIHPTSPAQPAGPFQTVHGEDGERRRPDGGAGDPEAAVPRSGRTEGVEPRSEAPVEIGSLLPEIAFGPLGRADIVRYAGASGDFNPIHIDESYARRAGAPGVFAMGMLPAGYLATAVGRWFGGALRLRHFKVRFTARVWPGDVIACTGRVASIDEGVAAVELVARRRGPVTGESLFPPEEVAVVGGAEVRLGSKPARPGRVGDALGAAGEPRGGNSGA
jgi:peroxisomal enoyl-CoA hydratase 2